MENCVRPRLRRCPSTRNPGLVEQSFHDCSSVRGDLRFFSLWEGSECKLGCTWGARIVTCVVLDYCDFRGVCGSVCTGTHVVAEQPRGGCHGPVFLFSLSPPIPAYSVWYRCRWHSSPVHPHLPSIPVPGHSGRHLTQTPAWRSVKMTPRRGFRTQIAVQGAFRSRKGDHPWPALLAFPLFRGKYFQLSHLFLWDFTFLSLILVLILIWLDSIAVWGVICSLPAAEDPALTLSLYATDRVKSQLLNRYSAFSFWLYQYL